MSYHADELWELIYTDARKPKPKVIRRPRATSEIADPIPFENAGSSKSLCR